MLKQGPTWFTLTSNNPPEIIQVNQDIPEMACDLALQCHFLYGFFHFYLPEDTIDVEITVRTLRGIHNFRKDHVTQLSMCSPWGT